ncbi:glycosyltransferase, partial [Bacillaceae bacterium Marseille-Q3522]|nr:glycosyltransferase [Bacillaceae bacterium Marseille-Q3522]
MTAKVSLCMIVKNEERSLRHCLDSVKNKVNEIIIVDTGSTDATKEVAKEYNAIIKEYAWNDDFSAARNYSISFASNEYILIMDADEVLDQELDIKKEIARDLDYYILHIKNYDSDGHTSNHQAIRLFKNNIGLQYGGSIHEHLQINFTHSKDTINGYIHHFGYLNEVVKYKKKEKRNKDLLIKEVKLNPSGYNYYNLGKQLKIESNYPEALKNFQKAFNKSKGKTYLSNLVYHLADCLRHLRRFNEALHVLKDATAVYPEHTDLFYLQGLIYLDLKYYSEAIHAFQHCLKLGDSKESNSISGTGGYLSCYALSMVYKQVGDRVKSFEFAYQSLKEQKSNFKSCLF